jgi:hypothetical protein
VDEALLADAVVAGAVVVCAGAMVPGVVGGGVALFPMKPPCLYE